MLYVAGGLDGDEDDVEIGVRPRSAPRPRADQGKHRNRRGAPLGRDRTAVVVAWGEASREADRVGVCPVIPVATATA